MAGRAEGYGEPGVPRMGDRVIHGSLQGLTRLSRVIPILVIGWGLFWGADTSSTWGYQSADAAADSSGDVPPIGPLIFTQVPIEAHQMSGVPSQRHARVAGLTGSAGAARLPDGSRIVSFDSTAPVNGITLLTASFHTAGQPDLSFDGRRIIFLGKRAAADPLDVWEMNVDGSELRRITQRVGNCTAAIYLPTIYTIDAEEPFHQIAFCSDAGSPQASPALYTCRMDGTRIRRITFNPYGASDPFLLSDGRLLFSSWRPAAVEKSAGGGPDSGRDRREAGRVRYTALFTVNTDGTDVFVFAGAHGIPAVRGMPCETPAGQVVYVESASTTEWDRGGALISVSRKRSLHTRRVLVSDSAGSYRSPSAVADGTVLVSYRGHGTRSYGLYLVDTAGGTRIGKIYDDAQWHDIDAVQVRPRPTPAGRSSVVGDQGKTGLLYGLNAYLSDIEGPHGINDVRIHSVRVIEALDHSARQSASGIVPRPPDFGVLTRAAANPDTIGEEALGTVPVESDGSFFMEVPAKTPLRLQTLDAEGAVLQTMRSWIWVMPDEARGCIGCHADRELTPPNRHVLALRKPPHLIGRPPVGRSKSESSGDATARRQDVGGSK